jgi:putative transposase
MKKAKLSDVQIVSILNAGISGIPVTDICRKYQIANSTYYKLKAKYEGMNVSELKRLKALEEENRKLKQMYADISLEHNILREVLEKKYPELIGKN